MPSSTSKPRPCLSTWPGALRALGGALRAFTPLAALLALNACSSIREQTYVGQNEAWIRNHFGDPTEVYSGYVAIPPRRPIDPRVARTMFYRLGSDRLYLYVDDTGMVVESLSLNENIRL